jgi:TusA-related sulfurtransferase/8-oxo-dGTP pyrophosphatase MutT (NUDIX family)
MTFKFCPNCATPLELLSQQEDGGAKTRLRCPACAWTHWNNPTPVLAAVIELADRDGQLLLARNAAWSGKMFGLITGFMEAGETPQEGIAREVAEETSLQVDSLALIGVYDFQRMNQLIVAYHAVAHGEISLSPELPALHPRDGALLAGRHRLRFGGLAQVAWPHASLHRAAAACVSKGITMDATTIELDTRGLNCPLPILKAKKALAGMQTGELLKVVATDPGSVRDFQAFARQTGNELVEQQTLGDEFVHLLRRR